MKRVTGSDDGTVEDNDGGDDTPGGGNTPTDQSLEYEGPITLSETTVVKAIAK